MISKSRFCRRLAGDGRVFEGLGWGWARFSLPRAPPPSVLAVLVRRVYSRFGLVMLARASNSDGLVVRALVDVLVVGLENGIHALHEFVRVGAGQGITTQAVLHEVPEGAETSTGLTSLVDTDLTGLVDSGLIFKPLETDWPLLNNVLPDMVVGDVLALLVSEGGLGKLVHGHIVAFQDDDGDSARGQFELAALQYIVQIRESEKERMFRLGLHGHNFGN